MAGHLRTSANLRGAVVIAGLLVALLGVLLRPTAAEAAPANAAAPASTAGRVPSAAPATTGDVGHRGPAYTGAGDAPTADKPQSKLWFNDGLWWADMFDAVSRSWHIFRLDRGTQTWSDTGTVLDDRPATRADTLWDGTHLYVASNVLAASSAANASGQPARLYRYSYDATRKQYTIDSGFPVKINNVSSESLTLDKDSSGVLWATWTQGRKLYVNNTTGTDLSWSTPFTPSITGASGLAADDISTLAAYGRSKIGLMWSNQTTSTFFFATHRDGDPRTTWTVRAALSRPGVADDHLSLKQLESDDEGRLFAAVKTGLETTGSGTTPQNLLLALDVTSGAWTTTTFGTVADCHTRAMIVIDRTRRVLHMFATAPSSGSCAHTGAPGTIYEKTTSLDRIAFTPGRGTPVIRDAASANLNDVTGTKQSITSESGLVLLAGNDATDRYWHADVPLGTVSKAPTVGIGTSRTTGKAPLAVTFTATVKGTTGATGGITAWSWTFGDGGRSTAKKPSHTYRTAGTYTVTLTGRTASGVTAKATRTIKVTRPSSSS